MDKKIILSKVNIGNTSYPRTGLLCGEICENYSNTVFKGATFTPGGCSAMVRDFLNYTLDRSVIENARIITESDYKTVQKKIEYLIKRFKK